MSRSCLGLALALGCGLPPLAAEPLPGKPTLLSAQKIWDKSPHNAFTDLIRHKNEWLCVFREGDGHVSANGMLRVLASKDGESWESASLITSEHGDLRDAKIVVTPTGQLMLCGAVAYPKGQQHRHMSLAWFSEDGRRWSPPVAIGEPDYWLWRVTWRGDAAYGVGYGTNPKGKSKLYRSTDGKTFQAVIDPFVAAGQERGPADPTEASIMFRADGTGLCLHRRDGTEPTGLIGTARAPYTDWTWKDLGVRIGGPQLIELSNGRIIAVVRLYDKPVRTSVCDLNPSTGEIKELLALPSGGDTSYAGLVEHEGVLWVSYYSSHEGKTSIYLAKVKF